MTSPAITHNAFFVSSSPLLLPSKQPCALSSRRPPRMLNGGNAVPPPGNGDNLFGRFREFTSSPGDAALQDDLVREVLWQAARTATTETMESAIQDQLDAVSDTLADMYSRGERNLRSRHEELARQTSLPNISKWNQTLIESGKMSKRKRSEIDKELAIVDALLRRNRRAHGRRNRSARLVSVKSSRRGNHGAGLLMGALKEVLASSSSQPARFVFGATVCTAAIESFEKIAAEPNGPSHLAKYAALSAVIVLMAAHLHAISAAASVAKGEGGRKEAAVKASSTEEQS